MLSLSKWVIKRVRTGVRVARRVARPTNHTTCYNGTQTDHTTSNIFTIESVLTQRTCQEIIRHMEKHFVEKKLVPQPTQVHYNSYLLWRILDERDAENRKAREALADLNKAALGSDEENTREKLEQVIDFINRFSDKGKSREDIISGLPLAPSVFVKEFFQTVARVAKNCILAEGVDNPQFQKRIIKIANSMSKVLCFITCRKPEDYQFTTFESAAAMVGMAILCPMTLAIPLIQPENLLSDFYNSLTATLSKPGAGYELYNQDWWWVFLDSLYG